MGGIGLALRVPDASRPKDTVFTGIAVVGGALLRWTGARRWNLATITEIRATDPLMSAVYALRREVFVVEQGVPEELEVDENDDVAAHLAALSDGHVIGTLRIVRHGRTGKIGRMAVSAHARKKGIGKELMEFAAAALSRDGTQEVILAAQLTAREFYSQLGYVEEGAVFGDAGIAHVMMRKKLQR